MDDLRKNASGYFDYTAYYAINCADKSLQIRKSLMDYIIKKIKFLREDFLVNPTVKEISELYACQNEQSVDRKAINIIISHWDKEDRIYGL